MKLTILELKERIIQTPYFDEWEFDNNVNSICDKGEINFEGLTDAEKMFLYVYAWNLSERCPFKRSVMKRFGWTSYKVQKLFRELKEYGMDCVPTFREYDLMLSGRGYMINESKINK
jgi:hypothetical protein